MDSELEKQDLPERTDLLAQLLKETSSSSGDGGDNFEKIKELVEKTAAMKKMVPDRTKRVDDYFNTLRERINKSSDYLEEARKSIETIKLTYHKDKADNLNSMSYLEFMDKSDEEIEFEMENIKLKLEELDKRVKTLKQNDELSAEESLNNAIEGLSNLNNGVYDNIP